MKCLTGYRQAILITCLMTVANITQARDDFVWLSYGGQQGYFDAPYVGLGFMADTWGLSWVWCCALIIAVGCITMNLRTTTQPGCQRIRWWAFRCTCRF